ncbi:helicase [Aspergillus brasiliensis]|nr:helicase [Aspergillus brasiliensis]
MLRRTADILAKYLPPKTEYVLFCKATRTQATIYQNVLASPVFQSALGNSESALQLITILKKLCNSPSLLTPRDVNEKPSETIAALLSSLPPNLLRHFTPSSSAKLRVLDQLLDNLHTKTSEKIVLVSNYTSTLNLLANLLTSLSLPFLRLDGSTPAQKRQSLVEDFNRLPSNLCFAFLLSAKAGGTGLNLIGASRLVLFDVDWNPATDIQAMARIHRDGQKRHCRIYRILLKGSLEEKIWQRQVTKIGLADSVMEKRDSVAQFSRDELKDLFRLDEESKCQTHELLGCDCGGNGQIVVPPTTTENEDEEDDHSSSSSLEDFPDLPTLIKASQLDMEKQERLIRSRSRSRPSRPTTRRSRAGNKHEVDDEDEDENDDTTEPANQQRNRIQQSLSQYCHIDPAHLTTSDADTAELLESTIDDDVLLSLLKDEDSNRIGFVFKKSSTAAAEAEPIKTKEDEKDGSLASPSVVVIPDSD